MEGERSPATRFLILHFNRFQKAPWRNANRLKCQNREGFSSRSADLILFSALVFFGERGRPRRGLWGGARCAKRRIPGQDEGGGGAPWARVSIGTPFRRLDSPAARRQGLSKILISNHLTLRFREGPEAGARKTAFSPAHPTRGAAGGEGMNRRFV